jgi:hypothetical protein
MISATEDKSHLEVASMLVLTGICSILQLSIDLQQSSSYCSNYYLSAVNSWLGITNQRMVDLASEKLPEVDPI